MSSLLPQNAHFLTSDLTQDTAFRFAGKEGLILGKGDMRPLPRGTSDTLADRLASHFAVYGPQTIVAGALPFDRRQDDYMLSMSNGSPAPEVDTLPAMPGNFRPIGADPCPTQFWSSVQHALDRLEAEAETEDGLRKVVLARSFLAECQSEINPGALFAALSGDPAVTSFQMPLPPRDGHARNLVGATPELLISKVGRSICSHPLAGSARRQADLAQDAKAAALLSRSSKDWREHQILVEYILDTLTPYCDQLERPDGTSLTSTRTMWHLGTWIEGRLRDPDTPSAVIAAELHPTPAICGVPVQPAMELISELEPVDRDFYAGAVGWCDGSGDGAWYVAIRCAEICGNQARLYAGAGIVPGSDPRAETEETGAKFGAMLSALGLPRDAGLAGVPEQVTANQAPRRHRTNPKKTIQKELS
ncbi:isochorismate synthase [Rhodobacteraceae bacterium B1Z28]|uniref:isochorismate synthase n=1 Tax=Ruegeria haliotis TaxID=2747601 RepID=A0ABX2PUW8_9RHOB|nr:isochorismate synthase [Ruegeria haliotis]NVO57352.1 isochorismate synthase [Ruegeria haliotis]